jgi:hypothetical protein
MSTLTLRRQVITDAGGTPVAVLLPIYEYEALTAPSKAAVRDPRDDAMERAASDPRYLSDLSETMGAFAAADTEWWEPAR